jgi:hypothetical protein
MRHEILIPHKVGRYTKTVTSFDRKGVKNPAGLKP